MPLMRVFRHLCLENPPKTIDVGEIRNFLDAAATSTIVKAVSAHEPLFDTRGEFSLVCSQKMMQIYII